MFVFSQHLLGGWGDFSESLPRGRTHGQGSPLAPLWSWFLRALKGLSTLTCPLPQTSPGMGLEIGVGEGEKHQWSSTLPSHRFTEYAVTSKITGALCEGS